MELEFEFKVSIGLVGCEKTITVSASELDVNPEDWFHKDKDDRDDMMYDKVREYMSEYVEYSWTASILGD